MAKGPRETEVLEIKTHFLDNVFRWENQRGNHRLDDCDPMRWRDRLCVWLFCSGPAEAKKSVTRVSQRVFFVVRRRPGLVSLSLPFSPSVLHLFYFLYFLRGEIADWPESAEAGGWLWDGRVQGELQRAVIVGDASNGRC